MHDCSYLFGVTFGQGLTVSLTQIPHLSNGDNLGPTSQG